MMGIADVFFWLFLTAIAVMASAGWLAASLFQGKQDGETLFVAAIAGVFWFGSYHFWPFQMAMKVAS